jgi:hypothetical protein
MRVCEDGGETGVQAIVEVRVLERWVEVGDKQPALFSFEFLLHLLIKPLVLSFFLLLHDL